MKIHSFRSHTHTHHAHRYRKSDTECGNAQYQIAKFNALAQEQKQKQQQEKDEIITTHKNSIVMSSMSLAVHNRTPVPDSIQKRLNLMRFYWGRSAVHAGVEMIKEKSQ